MHFIKILLHFSFHLSLFSLFSIFLLQNESCHKYIIYIAKSAQFFLHIKVARCMSKKYLYSQSTLLEPLLVRAWHISRGKSKSYLFIYFFFSRRCSSKAVSKNENALDSNKDRLNATAILGFNFRIVKRISRT